MSDTERHVVDVRTAEQWQDWLAGNYDAATEVWLRLFNKSAPEPGMSYSEAVEVALCFGWMRDEGLRHVEAAKSDGRWPG
ncbi:hypothetical protein C6A85_000000111355 [Mycobacterium sp. ITM-2017-0098]|nr:hypothetical protein C6A85_000000111355 [Mycobacterium sp. ITM-2017-0098]